MRPALASIFAALALTACRSPAELAIDVTTGLETGAFTADPPVTSVDVVVTSLDGSVMVSATAAPGGSFDLGNVPADQQVSVEVIGYTAGREAVMRGRSLTGLPLRGLSGTELPVFVQRLHAWSRPPGGLPQAHVSGAAALLGAQYILLAGGAGASGDAAADPKQVDAYDLLALGGARTSTAFSRTPETIVSFGSSLLLVDATGASWVDYSVNPPTESTATTPAGLSFADVAGGAVVASSDGRAFVVGGARASDPTAAVLEIAADGTLTARSLLQARKGAAAAWIDGVGLVVAGGSAEAPGLEVLASGATAFAARGYDADPTEGAGAVTDGSGGVGLVGGTLNGQPAATRLLDPTCKSACTAKEVAGSALPVATRGVTAYALQGTKLIVVGSEAEGMNLVRTFEVDLTGGVTELPLREPRRGAVPVPTSLASLAIVGGEHPDGSPATSIELYLPQ